MPTVPAISGCHADGDCVAYGVLQRQGDDLPWNGFPRAILNGPPSRERRIVGVEMPCVQGLPSRFITDNYIYIRLRFRGVLWILKYCGPIQTNLWSRHIWNDSGLAYRADVIVVIRVVDSGSILAGIHRLKRQVNRIWPTKGNRTLFWLEAVWCWILPCVRFMLPAGEITCFKTRVRQEDTPLNFDRVFFESRVGVEAVPRIVLIIRRNQAQRIRDAWNGR